MVGTVKVKGSRGKAAVATRSHKPGSSGSTPDSAPIATPARTREHADAGVRRCMELMTANDWISGASHELVASEFGVSPSTVRSWATNASRIIRELMTADTEEIRARLLAKAETIGVHAMQAHEFRSAAAAVELEAKLSGLLVQKHEVDVTVQAYTKLSKDDMVARAREQIHELQLFVDRAEGRLIDG